MRSDISLRSIIPATLLVIAGSAAAHAFSCQGKMIGSQFAVVRQVSKDLAQLSDSDVVDIVNACEHRFGILVLRHYLFFEHEEDSATFDIAFDAREVAVASRPGKWMRGRVVEAVGVGAALSIRSIHSGKNSEIIYKSGTPILLLEQSDTSLECWLVHFSPDAYTKAPYLQRPRLYYRCGKSIDTTAIQGKVLPASALIALTNCQAIFQVGSGFDDIVYVPRSLPFYYPPVEFADVEPLVDNGRRRVECNSDSLPRWRCKSIALR